MNKIKTYDPLVGNIERLPPALLKFTRYATAFQNLCSKQNVYDIILRL